jgi:hypothetical protein
VTNDGVMIFVMLWCIVGATVISFMDRYDHVWDKVKHSILLTLLAVLTWPVTAYYCKRSQV